jgi:integrase/recombinase XerD
MSSPVVRLKIRVRLSDGSRPFLDPVFSANGKLKPLYAVVNGTSEHHPEGIYHLRYLRGDKRVWEAVGADAQLAVTLKLKKEKLLAAKAAGVKVEDDAEQPPTGHVLATAIAEYLAETKEHKLQKTLAAYTRTLRAFESCCSKQQLEEIDRKDLLDYMTFLKAQGNGPRTVRNRIDYFQIFLHHYGLPSLLKGKDLPKFTDKEVRAYSPFDLGRLLGEANQEEADLLHFMLCTGLREQEVQFACWSDLDLVAKTYTVTEHLDLGFRPKDKEEGSIPIPVSLVELLQERRKRHPRTRLIFPGSNGKPNGHLLRSIKALALKAGLNCGHCINKAGKSCATHPVCRNFVLHKFRKTFATLHHKNGLPARTLMRLLRHSSLDVTLRYIADVDDEQTRNVVESTFAGIGQTEGAR